jgi:hypothetical protein
LMGFIGALPFLVDFIGAQHQEQKPENVHPGRTHITTSPKQPILRATDIGRPKMDNSHHQRSQESKLNTRLS